MNFFNILNCILNPYKFNTHLKITNISPVKKNLNKYYQYVKNNIYKNNKLTQIRVLSNFVYSMDCFYNLQHVDLFPYNKVNNIYKILIAEKMQYMYSTYYKILFDGYSCYSFNTICLYYICRELKKKINSYKKMGKLAFYELINLPRDELYQVFYDMNILAKQNDNIKQIDNDIQKNNAFALIQYGVFINNILYLQEFKQYIMNNYKIIKKYIWEQLYVLNNKLYYNNIIDNHFESLLYKTLIKLLINKSRYDQQAILKAQMNFIDPRTKLYDQLRDYYKSLQLIEKI